MWNKPVNRTCYFSSLLKVHLQLRGFSVFLDIDRLRAGKFDENLLMNIKLAKHFLLVLTTNALDRCVGDVDRQDWVHKVRLQSSWNSFNEWKDIWGLHSSINSRHYFVAIFLCANIFLNMLVSDCGWYYTICVALVPLILLILSAESHIWMQTNWNFK